MEELPFVDLHTLKMVIKVQSIFRGHKYRQHLSRLDKENKSALIIQHCWKNYITREKLRKVQEVFALRIITKVVHRYKMRKTGKQHFDYLKSFDRILNFYPSGSRDVDDTTKSRQNNSNYALVSQELASQSLKKEDISLKSTTELAEPVPTSIWAISTKKSAKKVQFIDLPPPWHNRDERRIAQNQKDDMLFLQKSNFAWAKGELMPLFWGRCSRFLDMSDDLKARNERYIQRYIQCPFILPLQRCTKPVFIKSPHCMISFPGKGIYMVATVKSYVMAEIESFGSDRVLCHAIYQTNAPLLDAVIQPCSGQVIGIDSHWVLHLFEMGISVLSRQLKVKNWIPLSSHFLMIDHYGMLWINLLYQGGDLYCCDTLSLHPTLVFKRDFLLSVNIIPKRLIMLVPLGLSNQPTFFAATYFAETDVIIYSSDFSVAKKLHHKNMRSTPIVKQCGTFLIVYSTDRVIYVYQLNSNINLIKLLGTITVDSAPTDVCTIDLPPLILVSCDDSTLHIYLSQDITIPLRIPESKLSDAEEIKAANKILGPVKYTTSRLMFTELRSGKFTSAPTNITVLTATDKCSIVLGALQNGSISSISIVNDAQMIPACEFDTYQYYEPLKAAQTGCDEYNSVNSKIQMRRAKFLERIHLLNHFDGQAITGQMKNIFYPGSEPFSLADLILKTDTKALFSFMPSVPEMTASVYEVFHLMRRAGILSNNLSSLDKFIEKFECDGKKRDLTITTTTTLKFATDPRDIYYGISDLYFEKKGIESIIKKVNPLNNLFATLSKYTIGETHYDPNETSTSEQWLKKEKRVGLTKVYKKLEELENVVKHELMRRVQDSIDESFNSNLLDKMLPIPSLDLRSEPKEEELNVIFDDKPNRNPTIELSVHQTIVNQYSKRTFYAREREKKEYYKALLVPNIIYQEKLSRVLTQSKRFASALKKVSQVFHSFEVVDQDTTKIVFSEDNNALPLSYFLTIHSFLGSDMRLLFVCRSICCRLLGILYQLHQKNVVVRTIYPDNIMHNCNGNYVMIGSLFDSQFPDQEPLPLPKTFADPSNPFIPPEYYHKPLSEMTYAFDVWQFGILLLYLITGTLPLAYGSEMFKHAPKGFKEMEGSTEDHPIYPHVEFFYDWLSNANIVGSTERCIGERGTCFIQTDKETKNGTKLDVEHYTLLPYKNTKLNYDESKLFLEIISECLQTDPEKRPTIEVLLRTYPFNQPAQSSEQLEMFLKTPNPDVFVSQFIYPVIKSLSPETFDVTVGIIQAVLFHDDDDDDDARFSFPLESLANSRVINSLFSLKFLDKLVFFVLDNVARHIQLQDVAPVVKFQDAMFDKLLQFFMRFVSSVEAGTGPLIPYTNEMVMNIFALYTGNPYFRFNSGQILSNKEAVGFFQYQDSAPLFVFCHTKVHGLVRYILSTSAAIINSIKRTEEHDDWYFTQFLNFGEANYSLSHSLCYGIEKQRGNAIKTLTSMWQNGQSSNVARIFIDFKIFQKTIHCLHLQGARFEALELIRNALHAIQMKMYDPTYKILWYTIVSPLALLHVSNMMKVVAGAESLRNQAFDIVRVVTLDQAIGSAMNLVSCDILYNLFETTRESMIKSIVEDLISKGNPMFIKIIMASHYIQKILAQGSINVVPFIDLHQIDLTLDVSETFLLGKQLSNKLYMYQFQCYKDKLTAMPPINEAIKFFPKAVQIIQREADSIAKFYDTQMLRAARFDLKETTFLRAKNKLKEQNVAVARSTIDGLCPVFFELYKNLLFFFQSSKRSPALSNLLHYILDFSLSPIPSCRTKPHPMTQVFISFSDMIVYTLTSTPKTSFPFHFFVDNMDKLLPLVQKDYDFIASSAQKSQIEVQVADLYMYQRFIRFSLFKVTFDLKIKGPIDVLINFLLNGMLSNPMMIKIDVLPSLNRCLKFPIRDEALGIIKHLLVNYEKNQYSGNALIEAMSTDKFIDNERKLMQVDDNVLLIDSSLELMNLLLSSAPHLNEKFKADVIALCNVFKSQYVRKFDPTIFDIPEKVKEKPRAAPPPPEQHRKLAKIVKKGAIISPTGSRSKMTSVISKRSFVPRK